MTSLKGTKTEKNILPLLESRRLETSTLTGLVPQETRDLSKFRKFLPKQPIRKKSMQSDYSNFWKAVKQQ